MFHFATTFRLGLGPTQCPIKWITGALCILVQHTGFDFKAVSCNYSQMLGTTGDIHLQEGHYSKWSVVTPVTVSII